MMLRYVRSGLERMRSVQRMAEGGLFEERRSHERAQSLLLRCLTPAQRAEFERSSAFTIRGQSGQMYRITYGTAANVELLGRSGTVVRRLCAGPVGVPVPAVMLAQKLMLENQEREFLSIAALGTGTTRVLTA